MLMYFGSLSSFLTRQQSALVVKCPQGFPAANSEQISNATPRKCHSRWRASEGTVLENSPPRWLVGSPSPSSVYVDLWSCSQRSVRTWWQEQVLGSPPSALSSPWLSPLPLWPLRQHKALFTLLTIITTYVKAFLDSRRRIHGHSSVKQI